MKTNLTKLFVLSFFLLSTIGAVAQDNRNIGENHRYSVAMENTGNGKAWAITGTQNTDWSVVVVAGEGLDQDAVTIQWQKPGTYTMSFTESEVHGALTCETTKQLNVTVSDNFTVAIAAPADLCASAQTGNTSVTFTLTKTNGDSNWTFDYTTQGLTPEISGTAVAASGNTYNLVLDIPNVADGSDHTFSVVLSNIQDGFLNVDYNPADDTSGDLVIYGLPSTSGITAD